MDDSGEPIEGVGPTGAAADAESGGSPAGAVAIAWDFRRAFDRWPVAIGAVPAPPPFVDACRDCGWDAAMVGTDRRCPACQELHLWRAIVRAPHQVLGGRAAAAGALGVVRHLFLDALQIEQPDPESAAASHAPLPAPQARRRHPWNPRGPVRLITLPHSGGLVCPSCSQAIEEGHWVATAACGHRFHAACSREWIQRGDRCPGCFRGDA